MTTLYPNSIDGYTEIRVVVDRNTNYKIDARDHNDLRSAVIAIEQTLGLNPQGIFGSVKDRLEDGYSNIALHASGAVPRHSDEDIDASAKTGTITSLSSGTVNTQVQDILNYLNSFHDATGAGTVGATGFTTAKNNYTFSGANVQEQLQEIGNFMDFNIDYLQKSFNSFIVEGFSVTIKSVSDLIVDIEAGYIASNGVVLNYAGAEDLNLLSTPGNGTFYIYAYRELDEVRVRAIGAYGIAGVMSNINTVCLLSEVFIDGSEYTILDLRRFGVFMNDKNGVTVGKAPVNGFDGYGCDFISLKAAVKFVSLCKETGNLLVPGKITLVSDITINSEAEAEIELTESMEIDGAGNTIIYSAPTNLFSVEQDNITIRNLNVLTSFSTSDWSGNGYFILGAVVNNIENLKVLDCTIDSLGVSDLNSFITLCGSGNKTVDGLIVRNNNVAVGISGIIHNYPSGTASILNNAIIDSNIFYQTTYSAIAASKAIVVGSFCKVSNNFIKGGYLTGVEVVEGTYTDIQGNTIIGESSATYYMNNGIVFKNSANVVSDNLISHNIIRGVNSYGINCRSGLGYLKTISIDNNIIDNSASISPPTGMVAINSYYLTETTVSNNMILYPGASAGIKTINEATQVIGNYIYCVPQTFGSATSILIYVVKPGVVVSQNVIKNSTGVCIYVGANSHGSIISNNTIYETYPLGANCISAFDCNYLTVTNNTIVGSYSEVRNRGGIYLENCKKASLSRNSINNIEGTAIYTALDCSANTISNNIITNAINGINCGLSSSEYVIKDNFIIYDSTYTIATEDGIFGIGSNSIVEGNYIFEIGQGSSNYGILCRGIDKIIINNNVIVGLVGSEINGIDCSLSSNSKVSGNYVSDTYLGINSGPYNDISGNKIYTVTTNGIVTNGIRNKITENYIYQCAATGILNNYSYCTIENNYIYFTGVNAKGVSLTNSDKNLISNNFIYSSGTSTLTQRQIECSGCDSTKIYSNYLASFDHPLSGSDSYGIYVSSSTLTDISANYIYDIGTEEKGSVYLLDSIHNKVSNNYFYYPSNFALKIEATTDDLGKSHLISGNYVFGRPDSGYTHYGFILNDVNVTRINIVGNYIYNEGIFSCIGIYLGSTTSRNILLSSNFLTARSGSVVSRTVSFSNYTGLKAIGNISIGGVVPNVTIWSGGYVNSSDDNVFVS